MVALQHCSPRPTPPARPPISSLPPSPLSLYLSLSPALSLSSLTRPSRVARAHSVEAPSLTVAVLVGFAGAIGVALVVQGIVYLFCSYLLKRANDPATPGHIEHKIPEDVLAAVCRGRARVRWALTAACSAVLTASASPPPPPRTTRFPSMSMRSGRTRRPRRSCGSTRSFSASSWTSSRCRTSSRASSTSSTPSLSPSRTRPPLWCVAHVAVSKTSEARCRPGLARAGAPAPLGLGAVRIGAIPHSRSRSTSRPHLRKRSRFSLGTMVVHYAGHRNA